jgi:phthalate 4,5-dioxygenase oxygenase subunit
MAAYTDEMLVDYNAGSPMGELMRRFWIPAVSSGDVEPGGAPKRLRLLGESLVAFRAEDGRVGVLDEACPHRGGSLALGHTGDCAIRCLFHGWKLDVEGRVLETPREADPRYGERVEPVGRPVEERNGVVWTYLGDRASAPPFKEMPFTKPGQLLTGVTATIKANWMFTMENTWDPTHVPILHRSAVAPDTPVASTVLDIPPCRFDVEPQPYGSRVAMVTPLGDRQSVRMIEYIFPWAIPFALTEGIDDARAVFMVTPLDNDTSKLWVLTYGDEIGDNVGTPMPGGQTIVEVELGHDRGDNWGQDRAAMAAGHWTGIAVDRPQLGIVFEDVVMIEAAAPVLDRSKHHLTPSDAMLVRLRRHVTQQLDAHLQGLPVPSVDAPADYLRPEFFEIDADAQWENRYPAAPASIAR